MSEGRLATAITEALRERDAMKAQGATDAELDAGFERVVRSVWPFTREWKYLCESCRDYGLVMAQCPGDATCGRTRDHLPHEYGRPCWCDKGARFRPKERTEETAVAAAAKVGKPSRWGR